MRGNAGRQQEMPRRPGRMTHDRAPAQAALEHRGNLRDLLEGCDLLEGSSR